MGKTLDECNSLPKKKTRDDICILGWGAKIPNSSRQLSAVAEKVKERKAKKERERERDLDLWHSPYYQSISSICRGIPLYPRHFGTQIVCKNLLLPFHMWQQFHLPYRSKYPIVSSKNSNLYIPPCIFVAKCLKKSKRGSTHAPKTKIYERRRKREPLTLNLAFFLWRFLPQGTIFSVPFHFQLSMGPTEKKVHKSSLTGLHFPRLFSRFKQREVWP